MKEDKYNLILARSPNICSNGKATMHYASIVEPLSITTNIDCYKNASLANLYRRQE